MYQDLTIETIKEAMSELNYPDRGERNITLFMYDTAENRKMFNDALKEAADKLIGTRRDRLQRQYFSSGKAEVSRPRFSAKEFVKSLPKIEKKRRTK